MIDIYLAVLNKKRTRFFFFKKKLFNSLKCAVIGMYVLDNFLNGLRVCNIDQSSEVIL